MRPPRCAACGDETSGQTLVKFADYHDLPDGMAGHPQGLEWFCARHVDLANRFCHLTIDELREEMKRRRWLWPFA